MQDADAGLRGASDVRSRLVEQMLSAVKCGALYGPEHPQRARFMSAAHDAFRSAGAGADLTFEVLPDGLDLNGEVLTGADACEMARRLASGGVRRLELAAALDAATLEGLLSLLALDFDHLRLEDDLSTLLWDRDWPGISWDAYDVPLDSPLEDDEPDGFNSSVPEDPPAHPLAAEDHALEDFQLDESERSSLAREVASAEEDPSPEETGAVLCQIVALEKNAEHIEPVLEALRSLIHHCVRTGRFRAAGETARLLDRFGKHAVSLTEEKLCAIEACQASFASVAVIDDIVPVLESGEWDDDEAASAYLEELPVASVPRLIDAFFDLERENARRVVRRAIAALLRRDPTALAGALSGQGEPRLIEMIGIVGEVGSRDVVPFLKETCRHGSPEVRLAAIDALAAVGGAHARAVVARALSDSEQVVRCRAARAMPSMGATEGLDPLLKEMLHADFRERDLDERLVFFRALGSANVPEVLPFLRRLLQKRSWAFLGRRDDERRCAAAALAVMTHPEALALRAELVRTGPSDVKDILDAAGEEVA